MNPDKTYGVYFDEENKLHYYNCAPIKQKRRKRRSLPNPLRKFFSRLFDRQNSTTCAQISDPELSVQSDMKK
ncbi:hypothetical protein DICVIV_00177 [Dictyocaulus viviparus]|uniref:Uncharacterized protein n=1 Tax=Dictyocaulus viviparus TaxID=29172 RepID=A0A0D8YAA5_DICVI|nr:hypothetical protein DICVIV_00177 [Dictyocaulus viviparus]